MAELNAQHAARQHLSILHKHVLDPLSTAERLAAKERAEVGTERDAFEEFADRVGDLSAVTTDCQTAPLDNPVKEAANQRTEELRRAYEATVMSVSHYDDIYGETLEENIVVEFGAEIAVVFRVDSPVSFTSQHKELLISMAKKQAQHRADFCDTLESEIASVQSIHRDLSTLLETLDNSIVPAWHCKQFLDRLDEIQASRQSTLFSRSLPPGYDNHTLCDYLYRDVSWTYPGLTAAARLLDSVVLQEKE